MGRFLLPLVVLFALCGCNYRIEKVRLEDQRLEGEKWYAWIDRTVFQPRCVSCHGGQKVAAGVNLTSHAAVMASEVVVAGKPEASLLFKAVSEGKMPVGPPLPQAQVDRIRDWILAGAPGEGTPVKPEEPKPEPTYSWLSKNLFEPKCLKCHTGDAPKGDVDFTTYASLMASEGMLSKAIEPGDPDGSAVMEQIVEELMPPGPNKVSNDIRAALAEWIRKGAPED